jgi:hypothetical protein
MNTDPKPWWDNLGSALYLNKERVMLVRDINVGYHAALLLLDFCINSIINRQSHENYVNFFPIAARRLRREK